MVVLVGARATDAAVKLRVCVCVCVCVYACVCVYVCVCVYQDAIHTVMQFILYGLSGM